MVSENMRQRQSCLCKTPNIAFGILWLFFFLRTGKEKLKELEELMSGQGIFDESFSCGLGDFLEVEDEGRNPQEVAGGLPLPDDTIPEKKKKDPFPPVDGPLSAAEIVDRYKKAILSRQGVFRDLHQKWTAANPSTGTKLIFISV